MATLTFDTLKFVETLKAAGMPEGQAKAISSAVRDAHETAELATKVDLKQLEQRLDNKLEKLELRIEGEMKLLKWMMGLLLAGVASLILKAFF